MSPAGLNSTTNASSPPPPKVACSAFCVGKSPWVYPLNVGRTCGVDCYALAKRKRSPAKISRVNQRRRHASPWRGGELGYKNILCPAAEDTLSGIQGGQTSVGGSGDVNRALIVD